MAVCDICGAPETGTIVSSEDMRKAVFKNGFNPFALGLLGKLGELQAAFGISTQASFENWRNTIVAQDTSDWNICSRCMSALSPYLEGPPRPTGVTKARVSTDLLVGARAAAEAQRKYSSSSPSNISAPRPAEVRAPPKTISRAPPRGVKVLAVLELLFVPSFIASGYYLYLSLNQAGTDPAVSALGPGLGGALGLVLLLSAVGLWKGKGWGMTFSVMFAVIMIAMGLIVATFTPIGGLIVIALSAAILYYLTRPHVREFFRSHKAL